MPSRAIEYLVTILFVGLLIVIRLLAPEALTGDLILVFLLVLACAVAGSVMAVGIGVAVLWLSLFSGTTLAVLLLIILPILVFFVRRTMLTRWNPWVASGLFAVVGTLVFHAAVHPHVFTVVPFLVARGTLYALLDSIIFFGILRALYAEKEI